MGGDTPEWRAFYALQRRRIDFRKSPAGQHLQAEFDRKHASIKQEYQRIIDLSRQILEIDAQILNKLDHELAEKLGVPPPEPINKEGFYGRRCASTRREDFEDVRRRRVHYRDPGDGCWTIRIFDTRAEALAFRRQIDEDWIKIKKRKKAKKQERLKRWVYERLQIAVEPTAEFIAD